MPSSYYKYVERGAESQINWGEIGKTVSDMIAAEAAVREQKKAAIDESSRQFGEVLSNAPTGAFTTANEWTLNYANDAAQALLLLDRQLKTGQISLKDYTIKRQNLNDSTNEMFNLSKMYQDKYNEALKRSQEDKSSKAEMEFINQVEGLSNFKDSKAYINPTDYTVSVGKMIQTKGANGETVMMLDPNPNNYKRVNQLKNYMDLKIDKYNYTEAIDSKVASLGKNETTVVKKLNGIYRTYGITDISDPTQRAKFGVQLTDAELKSMSAYELWEKNTIAAQFANPYVLQSVLMDAVAIDPKTGEPYQMTTNAEEAKSSSKYIYFEDDGSGRPVPKPTKEQEQVAEGFMRTMIRNSIDQVSKTDTQAMPSIEWSPYQEQEAKAIAKAGANNNEKEEYGIYEAANNALRTGNKSALNTDDYWISNEIINGRRVIVVRPKSENEKKNPNLKNPKPFKDNKSLYTKLVKADDVAAYLKGVTGGKEKYNIGRKLFQERNNFTFFGTYNEGDETMSLDTLYSPSTYTEEARAARRYNPSGGEEESEYSGDTSQYNPPD
jgi:hypothetical protein